MKMVQYETGAPLPARCATTGHSIQSTAVPLRLANSHHKLGLQDRSTPPTATTTQSHIPPPNHHYVRVSCLKAMCSIWKGQKCLLGHNAELLQRKCCACCFAQRHGYVCLQWSRPPRAVLIAEGRECERGRVRGKVLVVGGQK